MNKYVYTYDDVCNKKTAERVIEDNTDLEASQEFWRQAFRNKEVVDLVSVTRNGEVVFHRPPEGWGVPGWQPRRRLRRRLSGS